MGEEGNTHYINVSTPTSMRQCNDEIHTGGSLSENINESFGIIGSPLQPGKIAREFFGPVEKVTRSAKPCRLAGHLVKTKILTEAHCSLFKIYSACGEKKLTCGALLVT